MCVACGLGHFIVSVPVWTCPLLPSLPHTQRTRTSMHRHQPTYTRLTNHCTTHATLAYTHSHTTLYAAGGFPITLRHRLHCTIVRCSTAACSSLTTPAQQQQQQLTAAADDGATMPSVSNSCVGTCVYGEEHVSLNEVVIERGISPFLTNLECFCDGAFVTHVQVRVGWLVGFKS